jgi:Glycine zipper
MNSWRNEKIPRLPRFSRACRYVAGAVALGMTLALAGCYGPPMSPPARDALIGGAVGLGGGALVGSAVGSPGAGAAIGGLAGAGAGYIYGNQQERYWRYGGY